MHGFKPPSPETILGSEVTAKVARSIKIPKLYFVQTEELNGEDEKLLIAEEGETPRSQGRVSCLQRCSCDVVFIVYYTESGPLREERTPEDSENSTGFLPENISRASAS